jgi:hypothetical protein
MSVKAVVYPVQGKNSMTCMIRTGQTMRPRKKSDRTAEKNTLNGTLAKNKTFPERELVFSLVLTLFLKISKKNELWKV